MFGIEADELDNFAIDCCQEHIADIYGEESAEMGRFNGAVGVGSDGVREWGSGGVTGWMGRVAKLP
jgi:hypothetical protein